MNLNLVPNLLNFNFPLKTCIFCRKWPCCSIMDNGALAVLKRNDVNTGINTSSSAKCKYRKKSLTVNDRDSWRRDHQNMVIPPYNSRPWHQGRCFDSGPAPAKSYPQSFTEVWNITLSKFSTVCIPEFWLRPQKWKNWTLKISNLHFCDYFDIFKTLSTS